jgi:sensor histidine kinase regulating citrate/malate metabolism
VIDHADGARNWLLITVNNDRPGLPAEKRGDAFKRGPSAWMNPNPVPALACRL